MQFTTFINFNADLSSVYYLWQWLLDPKNKGTNILVHYCNLGDKNRLTSVNNVLGYFRNEGLTNFELRQSNINKLSLGEKIKDVEVIYFMSGVLLREHKDIRNILVPFNNEDLSNNAKLTSHFKNNSINNLNNFMERDNNFFISMELVRVITGKRYNFDSMYRGLLIEDMVKELPLSLFNFVYYCQSSRNNLSSCGTCYYCRKIAYALRKYKKEEEVVVTKVVKEEVRQEVKSNARPIKIGAVTPTCSSDRVVFLEFLKKFQIPKWTRKPDVHIFVDYPKKIKGIDLTERYKRGISQCFEQGCDLVFFIEDDDYYPPAYIEDMAREWEANERPAIIGQSPSLYYHILSGGYKMFPNMNSSSAHCTAISRDCEYMNYKDDSVFYDVKLWKNNKDRRLISIDNKVISIKHGQGECIGAGHKDIYKHYDDKGYSVLNKWIKDKEAVDFYLGLKGLLHNNRPLVSISLKDIIYIKNKVGAIYSTFYDLDMIEDSILSIRNAVDYIVVVHQKIGFNGSKEPNFNKGILKRLLDNKLVDDIIYYEGTDAKNGMLEKLNIGLKNIKKNNCDYVIAMSPDENYNAKEINEEIDYMRTNNIDTLYMPIKAYYYDREHYFIDTYFSQTIHKIDDRIYERSNTYYLCDPQKKMKEGNFKLSKYHCHHYTFMKEKYGNKLKNSIRTTVFRHRSDMQQIYDRLQSWKEGEKALVFSNDLKNKGKVILKEIELLKKPLNKIALCIPFYKRHNITSFVFDYYSKLKEELKDEIELILIAVGSEGSISKDIAESNDFAYSECPNNPISQKHNETYKQARRFNPDACIKVDSDTVITIEIFRYYNMLINEEYDYSGLIDVYFLFKNNLAYWGGYKGRREEETVGVGRFLSSNLLNKINWSILGDAKTNNFFDSEMTRLINKQRNIKTIHTTCKKENGYVIDIKSDFQLTKLEDFKHDELFPVKDCKIDFKSIKKDILEFNNHYSKCSVIIPTMWKSDYLFTMLDVYEINEHVSEVILIDNDISKTPDLSKYTKVKRHTKGTNLFVNPSWNWGVELVMSEYIAIINDDIVIEEKNFNNIIERTLLLNDKEMIGVNEKCYQDNNKKLQFTLSKKMKKGFGCFMSMRKSNYKHIPEDLKIWYGDDIQYKNNKVFEITGINIKTKMSTTVNAFRKTIAKQDVDNWENIIKTIK